MYAYFTCQVCKAYSQIGYIDILVHTKQPYIVATRHAFWAKISQKFRCGLAPPLTPLGAYCALPDLAGVRGSLRDRERWGRQ